MFLQYIKEKKSWLFFFLFALGLMDLIILLDEGLRVEVSALFYLNGLLLFLLFAFLIWRYHVEMAYTNELSFLIDEQKMIKQIELPEPKFLREQYIDEVIRETIYSYEELMSELKNNNLLESEYTAAWVHEVKAPLTAMKITIDENRDLPAIRKVETEWLRIHLLIDQQLSIARLTSHETDYLLENISLQRLVAMEVKELASWCLDKKIAVEFDGDDEEAVTDEKWCRFIIRQILTNAVKYSPAGSEITVTFQRNDSENPQILIADTGPGIPAHELRRVFDKGFTGGTGRLHNAATGLGLYLAQNVANKIGVTLKVHSEIGEGTTVFITFPIENEFDLTLK